jgi:hypothetical protein
VLETSLEKLKVRPSIVLNETGTAGAHIALSWS